MVLIGSSVLEGDGTLDKEELTKLLPKEVRKETLVASSILSIANLFKDDSKLHAISNTSVSPHLRSIADSTTNGLRNASAVIVKNIWDRFRS